MYTNNYICHCSCARKILYLNLSRIVFFLLFSFIRQGEYNILLQFIAARNNHSNILNYFIMFPCYNKLKNIVFLAKMLKLNDTNCGFGPNARFFNGLVSALFFHPLHLLNFLNWPVLLPFLDMSIIDLGDIKMRI
jgi:hypothetical protein